MAPMQKMRTSSITYSGSHNGLVTIKVAGFCYIFFLKTSDVKLTNMLINLIFKGCVINL